MRFISCNIFFIQRSRYRRRYPIAKNAKHWFKILFFYLLSIWREGEREKGRVHEDYKVTNMAPQSLLPDHCKEMKTHFKLNHSQLTRSPCLPLPAQHPVQIFAN